MTDSHGYDHPRNSPFFLRGRRRHEVHANQMTPAQGYDKFVTGAAEGVAQAEAKKAGAGEKTAVKNKQKQ